MLKLEDQPDRIASICKHLGLVVSARLAPSGDEVLFPNRITLEGQDAQWLLANRAAGLDALQYLLHEVQGDRDESRLAHLDVQSLRMFRMHEVKAMTNLAIQRARDLGKHTFGPMNSRERRWIHMLVTHEADLASESEGTGSVKALTITRKSRS